MDMLDDFVDSLLRLLFDPLKRKFGGFVAVTVTIAFAIGLVFVMYYVVSWIYSAL